MKGDTTAVKPIKPQSLMSKREIEAQHNAEKKSKLRTRLTKEEVAQRELPNTMFVKLRWVAICAMLIDHISHFLNCFGLIKDPNLAVSLRAFKWLSFSLFAFLFVESYYHTKHKGKHLLRVGILALVSELPFDLLVFGTPMRQGTPVSFEHQNVCFTFFLAFCMMWLIDVFPTDSLIKAESKKLYNSPRYRKFVRFVVSADVCGLCALAAHLLKLDWNWYGIVLIWFFKEARESRHRTRWTVIGMTVFAFLNIADVTLADIANGAASPYLFPLCEVLAVPFIIPAIREKKDDRTAATKTPRVEPFSFLTTKPFVTITRYFYPAHLVFLGTANVVLSAIVI